MTELGSHDPQARATALAYHQRITAALANGLRGAVTDRRGRAGVAAQARTLTASVIGALVLAHLDPAAADLCDQLAADLDAAPPGAGSLGGGGLLLAAGRGPSDIGKDCRSRSL